MNRATLLMCLAIVLSACGGGGDDDLPALDTPATGLDTSLPAESNGPSGDTNDANYPLFESGQVRPLARSPDGTRLFVTNTPAHRLDIFRITETGLEAETSVRVGLEPVAVAARSDSEVWVVNHLSDSVSVVDVTGVTPVVTRTLWVGDEPRDIVFAGAGNNRAFVTSARRGQNHTDPASLSSPGIGRASVWVFDANDTGSSMGGTPLHVVSLFGNTPGALERSPDGSTVYAAILHSGNRTTTVPAENLVKGGPQTDTEGRAAPSTGIIVRYDGSAWRDGDGNDFSDRIRLDLPDYDVFAIDATASTPSVVNRWSGVGSTVFNLAVNPQSGVLYASNLEARNDIRFEGSGARGSTVRGHFVENRITVINGSTVSPRHLNKHIDYSRALGTSAEKAASLATPLGMAVSPDGQTLYVAAFGSSSIGVFDTASLANNTFVPSASRQIALEGGGPSGLLLDDTRNRLYVLTRFDNRVAVVDLATRTVLQRRAMPTPEPAHVIAGRRFLYDARLSSSRGDSSCAGCHIFGDLDLLAWDLGNPDEHTVSNPNAYVNDRIAQIGRQDYFHPLKGPMTTQSLRGMAGNGPLHWRGDRPGRSRLSGESLEMAAFREFNGAFVSLLGRETPLPDADMIAFGRFAMTLMYPPNPYRRLDNALTADQAAGRETYLNVQTTGGSLKCQTCHVLDAAIGDFGTSGLMSVEGPDISQNMKVPHLRNMYAKVGMFGMGPKAGRDGPEMGNQIAGFGFSNDGSVDTLERFLAFSVFRFPSAAARRQVADFVLAFDSDMAPIMGQQVTLKAGVESAADTRVDLLMARAGVASPRAECDLVAHGRLTDQAFAARWTGSAFVTASGAARSLGQLKSSAREPGNAVTFQCLPPGFSPTWLSLQ